MKIGPALAGMALALPAGTVLAQPVAPVPTDPVVVTATRTARTADETLASVTIITRKDIERRQAQDLAELLRTQAGIDMARSGGAGGDVSLFLRGSNSNHVLVLIDGVRVASVTTGAFEWRSLPLAQIERIEIVRGPRASLYGSDAIGGVIQIFTRRPRGAEVAVGAGRYDTRRADAAWGSEGGTRAFVTGSHFETEGFSAQNPRGPTFNPDADGSRVQGVTAGFEAPLGSAQLEVLGRQSRAAVEFDQGVQDIDNASVTGRIAHATTGAWAQTLSVAAARDELTTRQASTARIRTERHTADWQNDFTLGAGSLLTAGLAYVQESGVNTNVSLGTTVFDREQITRAAFTLWQHRFGDNDVQLAGRYDDYSTVGGHGTWSAAYGRALDAGTRAWASYGTAFHAPTFNQLYHPGFGGFFAGNPDLAPERSRTAEIGLRHQLQAGHRLSVALFSTRTDDLIAFQGAMNRAINVDKASMRGAELEHRYDIGHWHVATTASLQRATDDTTDRPLLRRADRKLSALLERRFDRGAAGIELVVVSDRPDFDSNGNVISVAGYGLVNLAARYRLWPSLSLEARVENFLDKEYQVIEGYNTPGRSLFVTLRYQSRRQ